MNIPAIGDAVVYHPSKGEGMPDGTVLDAKVAFVDNDGRLDLTITDEAGTVTKKQDVIFMQDDRGPVPERGYAALPTDDQKKATAEREKVAAERGKKAAEKAAVEKSAEEKAAAEKARPSGFEGRSVPVHVESQHAQTGFAGTGSPPHVERRAERVEATRTHDREFEKPEDKSHSKK